MSFLCARVAKERSPFIFLSTSRHWSGVRSGERPRLDEIGWPRSTRTRDHLPQYQCFFVRRKSRKSECGLEKNSRNSGISGILREKNPEKRHIWPARIPEFREFSRKKRIREFSKPKQTLRNTEWQQITLGVYDVERREGGHVCLNRLRPFLHTCLFLSCQYTIRNTRLDMQIQIYIFRHLTHYPALRPCLSGYTFQWTTGAVVTLACTCIQNSRFASCPGKDGCA